MDKNNNIMKGQGEDGKWITVNGTHVFVQEGQSIEDAMNSKFDKKSNADKELTKRAEALHKTMKEAGLPVKKSIEETKAIMRNVDKMPDYGDKGVKDQQQPKTTKKQAITIGGKTFKTEQEIDNYYQSEYRKSRDIVETNNALNRILGTSGGFTIGGKVFTSSEELRRYYNKKAEQAKAMLNNL